MQILLGKKIPTLKTTNLILETKVWVNVQILTNISLKSLLQRYSKVLPEQP